VVNTFPGAELPLSNEVPQMISYKHADTNSLAAKKQIIRLYFMLDSQPERHAQDNNGYKTSPLSSTHIKP
jgi:hypothetical protein